MMDWEDLGDWIMWGMLASGVIVMAATAVVTLVVLVHHAVRYLRARKAPPPPSIEELLAGIPGVAYYRELPPGPGGGGEEDAGERRERCAICVTNYEDGEACSVLPGCAHMFHKPCVAKWLRKKSTCPLCRATVGRGVPGPPPLRGVENMV
ncbi:unnamed protein product [Urochloa decumbens]|uniref:RING-type domain-containing protein n=1 Tax=Urochloa decumbens TaxID=240449 RepID=A0ABC9EWP8_9POAL